MFHGLPNGGGGGGAGQDEIWSHFPIVFLPFPKQLSLPLSNRHRTSCKRYNKMTENNLVNSLFRILKSYDWLIITAILPEWGGLA